MSYVFLLLFLVPPAVLAWRIVVSRTRAHWLRAGAAAAGVLSIVGAFTVYDNLAGFEFDDWRNDIALLAAMSGSLYLLLWSLRRHSNRRHRSWSIIAAVVGLVPVFGTIAYALLLEDH